ncbi:BTAD domain-containing putative transcriptional regulator [Micromonospora sp. NPDC050397]|uniref:AfsR/SARP family transcriptional regulator n=1 Tax=Micromonospora sp. NPDC050397 TaxID=3364279 RepID=UPI003851589A
MVIDNGVPMEFGLLGPVRAVSGGVPVDVGSRKQRLVLAVLLLGVNRFVATTSLVRACWLDEPPPTANRVVHAHVSRLRGALAAAGSERYAISLARQGAGYVLRCDPMRVDVHRFRELVRRTRASGTDEERVALLSEALDLWRGAPLHDVANDETRDRLCAGLTEARLAAMQDRWDAQLRLGRHLSILEELVDQAAEHPQQQRMTGQLMLALYRSGRAVDALRTYRVYRERLGDEFGVDPGVELRRLELAILRTDPTLDLVGQPARVAAPDRTADRVTPVPAQLPPDVPGFVGRDGQLRELDAVADAGERTPGAVIISGTAGVGKTALALHWAHRARDRFTDGQLYVNLRGFDPAGRVVSAAEAIRGFLDALGVPPEHVPATIEGQTGRYRSLLAGKRMLVLLDNARDADQIRPLLPATPTVLTVVTSRNQLTSLLAVEGAYPLTLDVLSLGGAHDLLTQRVGAERTAAEPVAVRKIIMACARLPLALGIAAARARQSGFSLAALGAELGSANQSLDALDAGDPTSNVRAVFSWSIAALTPPAARLFRLLGQHPGPDVDVAAAASLAGYPVPQTRRLLTELRRASLLVEPVPGRLTCHDLLRVYAADLTATIDPPDQRRAATSRLLDHYTHLAYVADRLINPHRDPMTLPLRPLPPRTGAEPPADAEAATAWLATERAVLLAAVRYAAESGFDLRAWQLTWALDTFLFRSGHWRDRASAWQVALTAAGRLDEVDARADAHRALAQTGTLNGGYAEAHIHLVHALELSTRTGDRQGQARTHHQLAHLYERQDQLDIALEHALQALALRRAAGHHRGQAVALNAVGWTYNRLGNHVQALIHCEQALKLNQEIGNRFGQAAVWDSLGHVHHQLGDHSRAAECYQRSLALSRELGGQYIEADTLVHLGETQRAVGDYPAARVAWTRALAMLTNLDHPDAARVRAQLRKLVEPVSPAG